MKTFKIVKNTTTIDDYYKFYIREALGCEIVKSREGWSWYYDRILLVQEHTPLCDKLLDIIKHSKKRGESLREEIMWQVLHDLAKRQQFLLDTVNSFAERVEDGLDKVNEAEWRVSFYGGGDYEK